MLLCADGGGSKLSAILLDDDCSLLARAMAGGVNPTQGSVENTRENVKDCLSQLFSHIHPERIDAVYAIFGGPFHLFEDQLRQYCSDIGQIRVISESKAGNLAGGLRNYGVCANAGTGSDIFYYSEEGTHVIGGRGPFIGDEGSGAWMGQQALKAVVRQVNGWGPKTLLKEILYEDWQLKNDWDLVTAVQGSPAPFRRIAAATVILGKAARAGDQVAVDIIQSGAEMMALQTESLFRTWTIPQERREIVLFGGAWKVHPIMSETYRALVTERISGVTVLPSLFEPVCSGAVMHMLEQGASGEEIRVLLENRLSDYRVNHAP